MAPRSSNSNPTQEQQQQRRRLDWGGRCDALRQATEESCCPVMMAQKGRHTAGRSAAYPSEGASSSCPRIASSSLCVDPERLPPYPAASTSAAKGRVVAAVVVRGGDEGAAGAPHVSRRPQEGGGGPLATQPSRPPAPLISKLDSSEVLASRGHWTMPRPAFPLTSRPRHLNTTPPRTPHARCLPARWTLLAAGLMLLHLLSGVPAAEAHVQGKYS